MSEEESEPVVDNKVGKYAGLKFVSFTKYVAQIGGDNAKFSRRLKLSDTTGSTFFREVLTKWNDQDHSASYSEFINEIPSDELESYAQLLHNKDIITNTLLKYINTEEHFHSIPAFCELLAALARDLKDEFTVYIWPSFECLINILDLGQQEKSHVEAAFYCLTILVKVLWKKLLVKDGTKAFLHFVPLFGSSRRYVRRFAAESFGFLLRKLPDLREIVPFIITHAFKAQDDYLREGCGELFFNIFKGLSGGFHSTAHQFITEIIDGALSLGDEEREYGYKILATMTELTVNYIQKYKKSSSEIFENAVLGLLEVVQTHVKCSFILRLLPLLYTEVRGRILFNGIDRLSRLIRKIVTADFFILDSPFIEFFSQSTLLLFNQPLYYIFTREICEKLVKPEKIEETAEPLLHFFTSLTRCSAFDLHIMPSLGYCAELILDRKPELASNVIAVYAEVCVQKKPLNGIANILSRSIFFDITKHSKVKQHVISQLPRVQTLECSAQLAIVYPWLFNTGEEFTGVEHFQTWLIDRMKDCSTGLENSQLSLIIGAVLYLTDRSLLASIPRDLFETFIRQHSCSQSAILLLHIYILSAGDVNDLEFFHKITTLLTPTFFCPNSEKRKAALQVLNLFQVPINCETLSKEHSAQLQNPESFFNILLSAENTELTDSRTRLLHFRKLRYGLHTSHLPKGDRHAYEDIILRFGFSQFFVQFTLLWPGMYEFLSSFARGMDIDKFWSVLSIILDEVQQGCNAHRYIENNKNYGDLLPTIDSSDEVDFFSARVQILKFLASIPDIAERRTRILSPILLNLYENTIRKHSKVIDNDESKLISNKRRKAFCALLDVFARFKDPKSVYLEKKIRDMYEQLLSMPDYAIMKSTIACLFTYKQKELIPYKETFEKLVDEKTFKEELITFKIAESDDDAVLLSEHRPVVMPILIRILHGNLCMHFKKTKASTRRVAIFHYLGGCRPDELQYMLNIMLEPIIRIGSNEKLFENMEEICSNAEELNKFNMSNVQSTVINITELVRRIFKIVTNAQQTQILQVLLAIGALVKTGITSSKENDKFMEKCREIRKLLMEAFAEFFSAFSARRLNGKELRQLLSISVECYLEYGKSSTGEQIAVAPLSVLRLIGTFCKLPSYWPFLSIHIKNEATDSNITVFQLFINHLFWNGLIPELLSIIRKSIIDLLSLKDEQTFIDLSECDHLEIVLTDVANYGTSLVVQHLHHLLQFLTNALENENKSRNLSLDNLDLINRISSFVKDEEYGERLVQVILSQLERTLPKEETLEKLLLTLARLSTVIPNMSNYLHRIARLFLSVGGRTSRNALVQVIQGIINNNTTDEKLKESLMLVIELESWDLRKVNEPDHERRHAAYNKLHEFWVSDAIYEQAFLYLIINTHFYTLFHTEDIALRSAAVTNLRALVEHLGHNNYEPSVKIKIVDKNFISIMLRGFRSEAEHVREECVRFLAALVAAFPLHAELSYLVQLQNTDEELDFFSNLSHIQIHRRQRCINRLVNGIRDGKVNIPFEVLYKFIVPIIYHNLISTSSKTSAYSDESIRLYNLTLESAPWIRYIATLEHWLTRLDKETNSVKPIIRVLVAIIDAFHYDVAGHNDVINEDGTNTQAIAIRDKIDKDILPRLRKCINGKSALTNVHKKARTAESKGFAEDDDILRAPVALATVKLLQKMPESMTKQNLHGVILKLSWLVMARSYSVRETARKIGLQVCKCLGPKYLPSIIKEMKLIMNKGFKVHVVIYTVHTFIYHMQDSLSVGDLDSCLDEILDLSIQDQFENAAEEKEVGVIKAEVAEAKSNKTPETFVFLGKYVSPASLGKVLEKLREVLENKASAKTVSRVGALLTKFALGIKDNKELTPESQLVFANQLMTTNIDKMENTGKTVTDENTAIARSQSCLVLPEAPKRVGALVKTAVKSRVHVFVEFALQLLSNLLTKKSFNEEDDNDVAKLTPFVPLVTRCLVLKYDKIISYALRCMTALLHMELPSLQSQLKSISERLFVLLSDYSVLGSAANKHSVVQLNNLLFKAFTKIVTIGDRAILSDKNIALLLSYIETDVMDTNKQATAFSLIKSIIRKHIEHERLPEVIQVLAELSITSVQSHIREQSRDTVCEFIKSHPQAGNPKKWIEFFIAQLEYEYEDGRLSAAEVLHKMFMEMQQATLDDHFFFCVLKLTERLVNDESDKCRKYFTMTLRKLLESVSEASREDVSAAGCDWLESDKEASKIAGIELLVQLSFIEGRRFADRLPRVLSAIRSWTTIDMLQEHSISSLITLLNGNMLLLRNCAEAVSPHVESQEMYTIISNIKPLIKCNDSIELCHAASCLIGQCLSLWKIIPEISLGAPSAVEMIEWMCWLLKHRELTELIAEQCLKNIVFLAAWISDEEFEHVIKRLASISKLEMVKYPKEVIKRLSCFKVAAALAFRDTEGKRFNTVVDEFFPLLVREMNKKDNTNTEKLHNLASEIGDMIKSRVGEQEYVQRLRNAQKNLLLKAEERKRKIKEMAVTEPEKSAEMKRKRNIKKTQSRKRKLDELKPHRVIKRKYMEKKRLLVDED